MLKSDFTQAFLSRNFLVVILIILFIFAVTSFESIFTLIKSNEAISCDFRHSLILNVLSSNTMLFALPIICTLPYTTAFIDDIKSGYIKLYLHRTTKNKYVFSKLLSCILSGGMSLVIGIFTAYLLINLIFIPMETLHFEDENFTIKFYAFLLLYFFSGCFWSVVGCTFATILKSKYMAYSAPFIVYYILIIFTERYFNNLYVIYPIEWIVPSEKWAIGNVGVIIFLTELIILVSVLFFITAKRRINEI